MMKQQPLKLAQRVSLILSHDDQSLCIKEQIQTFSSSSYSCIFSTASFLCYHFPDLPPPGTPEIEKNPKDETYPSQHLSYNHYFEIWCDHFGELLWDKEKGFIYQYDDVMVMVCKVDAKYFSVFKAKAQLFTFHQSECKNWKNLQKILALELSEVKKQKIIGVINLTTSQLREDLSRPRVNMVSLLSGIWYQEKDQWRKYDILKGQIPNEQALSGMDTIIMTGSGLSVNDEDPNVQKFLTILRESLPKCPKLKVLGLCFGHQALAKMYGGKVSKYDLVNGIQSITFDKEAIRKYPYFKDIQSIPQNLFISEYHGDSIEIMPSQFVNIASSGTCKHEAMASLDGRCLSFQFHPEYMNHYTSAYELRVVNYKVQNDGLSNFAGVLRQEFRSKEAIDHHKESCGEIRKLVRNFIDWNGKL